MSWLPMFRLASLSRTKTFTNAKALYQGVESWNKKKLSFAAKLMCETYSKGPRAVQAEQLSNSRKSQIFAARYAERWTRRVLCMLVAWAGLRAWAHNASL